MGLQIEQGIQYQGEDWWKWWVWLDGTDDKLASVLELTYILHPGFPNPVRTIRNRETRFRLETAGWGTFTVYAKVLHNDDTASELQHELLYDDGKKRGYPAKRSRVLSFVIDGYRKVSVSDKVVFRLADCFRGGRDSGAIPGRAADHASSVISLRGRLTHGRM